MFEQAVFIMCVYSKIQVYVCVRGNFKRLVIMVIVDNKSYFITETTQFY